MDRVCFCSGSSGVVAPQVVAPFRLLDPLEAMGVDLLEFVVKQLEQILLQQSPDQ